MAHDEWSTVRGALRRTLFAQFLTPAVAQKVSHIDAPLGARPCQKKRRAFQFAARWTWRSQIWQAAFPVQVTGTAVEHFRNAITTP